MPCIVRRRGQVDSAYSDKRGRLDPHRAGRGSSRALPKSRQRRATIVNAQA